MVIKMKIAFYGTKAYDKIWFEPLAKDYGFEIRFIEFADGLIRMVHKVSPIFIIKFLRLAD